MSAPVTQRRMSPASMALAYQIWAVGTETGWSLTVPDLAERLGVPTLRVARVLDLKGWRNRLRAAAHPHHATHNCNYITTLTDQALESFGAKEAWE